MQHTGFIRIAKAVLRFTLEEIEGLMWLSQHHYYSHCISAGRVGGFLYGMRNQYWEEEDGTKHAPESHTLDFHQCDTLAKITEPIIAHDRNMVDVHLALHAVLRELNEEYRRNNPADVIGE